MLGTEYNWLVESTNPAHGAPKIRMAGGGMITLAIAVFCFVCIAARAEPAHLQLMREASTLAKTGDMKPVIAKLEAAKALRPDYPRILYGLARIYASASRPDDALLQLRELAAMGLAFDVARDPTLDPLQGTTGFAFVAQIFAANHAPFGRGETTLALPGVDGIIEGLACHPVTHNWYFGDVRNRCIWIRTGSDATATIRKFSADTDNLAGIFGLKLDEKHNSLWAATAALPEMKGYTAADEGRAALVEFDLATGRVKRSFAVPADGHPHVLGDLLLAADGSVFTSDSTAPIIWRLAPVATQLEKWVESADFVSLQGLAPGADGKSLVVADYANGLWRIDLASRTVALLTPPAHTTLFGIDGLYAVRGGFVAVQNGIQPERVVRIAVGVDGQPTAVQVLAAGQEMMTDLSLGQVVGDRFHFIGNSGWSLYADPKSTPAPRDVTVLSTQF